MIQSPIESISYLQAAPSVLKKKNQGKSRRILASSLTLTSLVDVFSIIVIYLLVSTSSGQNLDIKEGVRLPESQSFDATAQGVTVEILNDRVLLEGQSVSLEDLVAQLKIQKANQNQDKNQRILLQADKGMPFDKINPVIAAAMASGFETVSFAVIQKSERNN